MSSPMQSGADARTLVGKVAVVTGGSSGIGAATVRLLAAEGASVVIGYNGGAGRAQELLTSLPGAGHALLRMPLGEFDQHDVLAGQLAAQVRQIDILVHSAGYTRRIAHADLETLSSNVFNEILVTNAGGTFSLTRALMPLLQASGAATVVAVSSISAFTGSGSNIAYCAAKAALDITMVSLARALGPAVRFLCVSPGSVDTGFVPGRSHADLVSKASSTPLGRVVTPEDVAMAVLGCITHLRTATGTRVVIDGGQHL